MPVRWLKPSRILSIERFNDFEEFRPNDVLGGGKSTPLDERNFSFSRAILPLQDGLFVMQRSFARCVDANMGAAHGIGMVIPIAFHAIVNGCEMDNSMIGVTRGKIPTQGREQHPNTYLMLRFNSDMRHRGWADFDMGLAFYRMKAEPMQRLRHAFLDMFCVASGCGDVRQFEALNRPIQETLLGGLDTVLVPDSVRRARPGSFDKHRELVARLDEQVDLLGSVPLYSDDLAAALDVSVRTLQTATQAVHGLSLHQYLRLKRLWATRKLLLTANAGLSVKAAALANGFWHMGDFAKGYKATFGEMPSETLTQSRSR
ncbi:helix-turn-helix domain-containing protein [Bradyrhizobium liaoningense]|uniref:AraC family transcriptional regulator n=1 Tax=Bradyrhizobium liaoningense TaxID=43992 RepID=UPI001BA8523F|nr:helix-turn-helix domain-containing protein [Bradyrhizobium liaoningense]MBR0712490.1 AraC family transcriptional regulator [Bradyrhizobium liaoningense]